MTAENALEPREAMLDGSIHTEDDCCVRVVEPCRRCGGPRHAQGAYGALLEICERCPEDADAWKPAGTYSANVVPPRAD